MKLNEMLESRAKCIADARKILDQAQSEGRDPSAEERQRFDSFMDEADKLQSKIEEAQADAVRFKKIENAEETLREPMPRMTTPQIANKTENHREFKFRDGRSLTLNQFGARGQQGYEQAFSSYLRTGMPKDALQADVNTDGGYTVPATFNAQLIQELDDMVFIRQRATKLTLAMGESLGFASLDTDPDDAEWTAEIKTGSEDSSMAFGKREFRPYPLAHRLKVSRKLIRASAINVDALVRQRLAYKFAISEEKAFVSGSGAGEPLGLFTASDSGIGTSRDVSTGNTDTAITMDGLINSLYALKAQYRSRAEWLFHRDALKQIRKLKDGEGQYLWQPSTQLGTPDLLLGKPYLESEYVPSTFTSGKYVGLLGDFSQYWIVDALSMSLQVLYELYAETNQIGYIGRLECDGMPVDSNAFVRVKLA